MVTGVCPRWRLVSSKRMATDKMRQTLDRLRPWANERMVALALREWMQSSLWDHDAETGERIPLRLGDELERDAAAKIAAELHDIGQWAPELKPEQILGAIGFMLRNIVAGREATDYGDGFEVVSGPGAPSARTRQRYASAHGSNAVWAWMRESLQYDLDLAGLVHGGRTKGAARRWLERHPGKHAKDAPPPRVRRAA